MQTRDQLLKRLSDGRFHSGQQLAEALGMSRSAVWKQIQRLEPDLGLKVSAVRGRGYRLPAPLELLDAERIRGHLRKSSVAALEAISLLSTTKSTNTCASIDLPPDIGRARVWLAEHQTAGRGRRGRQWVSTFGENLYLSMAWRFDLPMTELAGLSLMAGVVVAEVLEQMGLRGHRLKWPNDVLVNGCKLAGILIEVSGEADGPSVAVLGVGINLRISEAHGVQIEQPWTDLARVCPVAVSRNGMAGMLVDGLIQACRQFSEHRLEPFMRRWEDFDGLLGQPVRISSGSQHMDGVYRGITPSGAMVLEGGMGRREYHAGEVSLRESGDP